MHDGTCWKAKLQRMTHTNDLNCSTKNIVLRTQYMAMLLLFLKYIDHFKCFPLNKKKTKKHLMKDDIV